MTYDIVDLADVADLADTCASWSFGMWGCQSGGSLEQTRADFATAARPGQTFATFVARSGGKPAGMASLRATDFAGRPDLTPWLASVYVHPEHRHAGLAHALVRRVEAQARSVGYQCLYLISEQAETLYAGLGWGTFDRVTGPHGPAVLMKTDLV